MPEISHVRIAVPEQGPLNRILREGGAQSFPQWLYAEPVQGASTQLLETPPPGDARAGLFPQPVDDWTEAPRGLVLVTAAFDRAVGDLEPALGNDWHDAGSDELLGATCRRMQLGRSILVLVEPSGEGYAAACLARFGEGPIAAALDGSTPSGRPARSNPIDGGPASYVRIGPGTAPTLIFMPPG
jgi:hypothetical protein